MTVNSISPGFIKLSYAVSNRVHVHRMPINAVGSYEPGDDGSAIFFIRKDGGDVSFDDFASDYMTVVKPLFYTDVNFSTMEFWWQPEPTSDPMFIQALVIGETGSAGTATVAYSQTTFTHRTRYGGILKSVFMDTNVAANTRDDAPFAAGARANYSNYLMAANSAIIGRDGGTIVAPLRYITKTNDALRKKYLLDG